MAARAYRLRALPKTEKLLEYVNESEQLSMIVRGHQCIEIVLEHLINEALPYPHQKLTERLPFNFKVDLAIGLSVVTPDTRGTLLAINTIRNKFAHDLDSSITEGQVQDLYNGLPPRIGTWVDQRHKEIVDPGFRLRRILGVAYSVLNAELDQLKDAKLYKKATDLLIEEEYSGKLINDPQHPDLVSVNARIKLRFDKLKAAQEEGEP